MNPGAAPVALNTAIDNRIGHTQFITLCHDRLMQRLALPPVALTEVDAQQPRFKLLLHRLVSVTIPPLPFPVRVAATNTSQCPRPTIPPALPAPSDPRLAKRPSVSLPYPPPTT